MLSLSKYLLYIAASVFACAASGAAYGNTGYGNAAHTVHYHYNTGTPPNDRAIIAKYSKLLKADEAQIGRFIRLYRFIEDWLGTRYKWGGCSRTGIDCSCFVQKLYRDVFNISINRTSFTQFYDKDVALFTNREQYELGDLVFFKTNVSRETRNNRVTHVGFYLANGYFVQSSSSGVNIANLNRGFWRNCLVGAGRLRESYYKKAGVTIPKGEIQQQNSLQAIDTSSDFNPVFNDEDRNSIVAEYAEMLKVSSDTLAHVKEIFEYIEKNRYAPLKTDSICGRLTGNYCLINNLFREVFGMELGHDMNKHLLTRYSVKLSAKTTPRFMDVVVLKPAINSPSANAVKGVYLINDYFLQLYGKDVEIFSLNDRAFSRMVREFYAFKTEIVTQADANLEQKRGNDSLAGRLLSFLIWQGDSIRFNNSNGYSMKPGDTLPRPFVGPGQEPAPVAGATKPPAADTAQSFVGPEPPDLPAADKPGGKEVQPGATPKSGKAVRPKKKKRRGR